MTADTTFVHTSGTEARIMVRVARATASSLVRGIPVEEEQDT